MTQEVINRVNYLGRGEKSLLTFQNRRGEEIGERSVLNQVVEDDTLEPIENDMVEIGVDTNLDVVDDVTGVDNPYEEYVDEWNKDVPADGDDTINQAKGNNYNSDTGVIDEEMKLEPTKDSSDTGVQDYGHFDIEGHEDGHFEPATFPNPSASPTMTTHDGGGRPTRIRKPVSRLIPSFTGKSYGTTLAQISEEMVGMTMNQSISHMGRELEAMEAHEGDRDALGVIMANGQHIAQTVTEVIWTREDHGIGYGRDETDTLEEVVHSQTLPRIDERAKVKNGGVVYVLQREE
jgi:hypothetical protein